MNSPGTKPLVLLADDEPMIRTLVRSFLDKAGYNVLMAGDGREAFEVSLAEPGPIAILVTDVEMPELDGFSAYRMIREIRPGIKVLFMSGGGIFSQLSLPQPMPFLQKPFGADALRVKLKGLLEESDQAAGNSIYVILVVDNDSIRRHRTRSILNDYGYAVLTTSSVEEAELVADSIATIDLIVTEVMFLGESGVHLAERVEASTREIPTLLISHFDRAVLTGVSGFAEQPEFLPNFFTPDALLTRVRRLLGE
jgi:DNA-binding response OmpR family regulator